MKHCAPRWKVWLLVAPLALFGLAPRANAGPVTSSGLNAFVSEISAFLGDFGDWNAQHHDLPLLALAVTPSQDRPKMTFLLWWLWMHDQHGHSSTAGGVSVHAGSTGSPSPIASSGNGSILVPPPPSTGTTSAGSNGNNPPNPPGNNGSGNPQTPGNGSAGGDPPVGTILAGQNENDPPGTLPNGGIGSSASSNPSGGTLPPSNLPPPTGFSTSPSAPSGGSIGGSSPPVVLSQSGPSLSNGTSNSSSGGGNVPASGSSLVPELLSTPEPSSLALLGCGGLGLLAYGWNRRRAERHGATGRAAED